MTHRVRFSMAIPCAGLLALSIAGCSAGAEPQDTETSFAAAANTGSLPLLKGYSDYQVLTDHSLAYASYLNTLASYGINFQRYWITGYNRAVGLNEAMPFALTGTKYDLESFEPSWFNHARSILQLANSHGMVAALGLFDHWAMYDCNRFVQTPWYGGNNINGVLPQCYAAGAFPDFYEIFNPDSSLNQLGLIQKRYVQHVVAELAGQTTIVWEIMNEPRDGNSGYAVARWHNAVAGWIRAVDPSAMVAAAGVPEFYEWDIYNLASIDMIAVHGSHWGATCPPNDDAVYKKMEHLRQFNKPIIGDDDGTWQCRNAENARQWAQSGLDYGAAGFNHKGDIYNLDHQALSYIRDATANPKVHVNLNDKWWNYQSYYAGQWFHSSVDLQNYSDTNRQVELLVVLEAGGKYYFWPSWTEQYDSDTLTLSAGDDYDRTVLEFPWPDVDPLGTMTLWTGLLEPGTQNLIAGPDSISFDYGG